MNLSRIFCLIGVIVVTHGAQAKVREISLDSYEMAPIFLRPGHSTLLRFQEKPKKVVIGNQDLFAVEFIENDVSLRPKGLGETNLFVYGEINNYGFILRAGPNVVLDDLIFVKRKDTQKPLEKMNLFSFKEKVADNLWVEGIKLNYLEKDKIYLLDLKINDSRVHKEVAVIELKNQQGNVKKVQVTYGNQGAVRLLFGLESKKKVQLIMRWGRYQLEKDISEGLYGP